MAVRRDIAEGKKISVRSTPTFVINGLLASGGLYREIYDLQLRPQEEVMLEFDVTAPVSKEGVR